MVGLQQKAFREGNYTAWANRGTITLSPAPDNYDYVGLLADSINEILYITYKDDQAGVNHRIASYQLPGLTLIGNTRNQADLQYPTVSGSGHGLCHTRTSYMGASFTGQYVIQTQAWHTIFVYKLGVLLTTLTVAAFFEAYYISPDAHYIAVIDAISPYKIEVLEGT